MSSPASVGLPAGASRTRWRRAWIEAARELSLEAQEIAATAPLEEVGPLMLELAFVGRLHPPVADDEDLIDRMYARARQLDPEAWAEHDRLEAERGVNPDLLGETPRNETERRMRDRRTHSFCLASDALLCEGRADLAEALRSLQRMTAH